VWVTGVKGPLYGVEPWWQTRMTRATYLSRNVGDYPKTVEVMGLAYEKVDDLRYGNQSASDGGFLPAGGRQGRDRGHGGPEDGQERAVPGRISRISATPLILQVLHAAGPAPA